MEKAIWSQQLEVHEEQRQKSKRLKTCKERDIRCYHKKGRSTATAVNVMPIAKYSKAKMLSTSSER